MAFLYGPADGTQNLKPKHRDKRFERTGVGTWDERALPRFYKGLTNKGTGANGVPGGEYPKAQADGFFVCMIDKSADPGAGEAAYRLTRGTKFYDFAPDATKTLYMLWSADGAVISGDENGYDSASDSSWEPGAFHAESMGGMTGNFLAWFNLTHIQEADMTGYNPGVELTIQKGRFKIAVSSDMVVCKVEVRDGTSQFLGQVDTVNPYVKP